MRSQDSQVRQVSEMIEKLEQSEVDQIVRAAYQKNDVFGVVFHISSADNRINFSSSFGNIDLGKPYYIASVNKLFISAILLRLYASGQININNKIFKVINP